MLGNKCRCCGDSTSILVQGIKFSVVVALVSLPHLHRSGTVGPSGGHRSRVVQRNFGQTPEVSWAAHTRRHSLASYRLLPFPPQGCTRMCVAPADTMTRCLGGPLTRGT